MYVKSDEGIQGNDIIYRVNNGEFEGVIQKQQQLSVAKDKDLVRKEARIRDIVDPHCLQILYLNIYVLADIYLQPPNQQIHCLHIRLQTCEEQRKL